MVLLTKYGNVYGRGFVENRALITQEHQSLWIVDRKVRKGEMLAALKLLDKEAVDSSDTEMWGIDHGLN